MKTKTTLLLSVALSMFLNVQAQIYMFQKTYGGTGTEYCYSTQPTSDGGYIMAGETDSYGAGSFDGYLIKTDSTGVITWSKTYGGLGWDWLNNVQQTSDGGYIVTGGTESSGNGQGDIWIIKTDASGTIQWQKTVGGADYDNGYDVRQTSDSGFIVCGHQYGDAVSTDNACLIKTSASGTVQWIKTYTAGYDEYAYTVEQTADGGYIIGGESYQNPGDVALIIKTDATGTVQWAKTYGGGNDCWVSRIIKDAGGNYFVAGTVSQPTYLNIWLARLDNTGTPVWSNAYAGPGALEDNCIWATRTSDGGFALCGATESFTSDYECFLLKTDSTGGPEWTKRYGGNSNDNSNQVMQTADGGYIIGSNTLSFGSGASIYLIKTDGSGGSTCNENIPAFLMTPLTTQVSAVTINDSTVNNSSTSALAAAVQTVTENILCLTVGTEELTIENNISIYPNPAKDKFAIGNWQWAIQSIELFDVTGRKVYAQPQTSNLKLQTIDISTLTNGMYFVRVRTETGEVIRKLVKE
ncbi:MAG TPA: T9SS type A sorting domain-containing protein [Bacteroidia bacterium]|nr:T9SS type A sorting domain-containing protein [Bacteroidia bacterium]